MKRLNDLTKNAKTAKAILKDNPKAMQFLHRAFGFDFCKPFEIVKTCGAFTLTTIKKATGINDINNYNIIILLSYAKTSWRNGKLYAAHIDDGRLRGYNSGDLRGFDTWQYKIGTFYGVGDFEEARKKQTQYIYIITQSNDYKTKPQYTPYEVYKIDTARRYKLIDVNKCRYNFGVKVTSITIKDTQSNAAAVRYCFPYIPKFAPTDAAEVIDKSGYITIDRKNELRERAAELRKQRAKAEYLRQDYTAENARAHQDIKQTARKASEQLSKAEFESDFRRIKECCKMLEDAASSLERHEKKTAEKDFASVQKFFDSLQAIQDKTTAAKKYLEPIQPADIHAIAAQELPPEDIDHHETDLYIKFSLKAAALVDRLTTKALLTTFRSQTDNKLWYELPFCYNPKVDANC